MAMVQSEGNMSLKNPVTPTGIDPGTVRLVAQRLNHYATPSPFRVTKNSESPRGLLRLHVAYNIDELGKECWRYVLPYSSAFDSLATEGNGYSNFD